MNKTNTISCHQLGIIAALLLVVLKFTSLPSLMYDNGEIGGIILITIIILFNIAVLGLIIWLKKKYKNKNLYDIFCKFLSVPITKILYFVLFVFFIFFNQSMITKI